MYITSGKKKLNIAKLHKLLRRININDGIIFKYEQYDIMSQFTLILKLKTQGWFR